MLLVTEHNVEGARAIMINHPTRRSIPEAVPELETLDGLDDIVLHIGGPVAIGGVTLLVQSDSGLEGMGMIHVFGNVYVSRTQKPIAEVVDRPRTGFRAYAG